MSTDGQAELIKLLQRIFPEADILSDSPSTHSPDSGDAFSTGLIPPSPFSTGGFAAPNQGIRITPRSLKSDDAEALLEKLQLLHRYIINPKPLSPEILESYEKDGLTISNLAGMASLAGEGYGTFAQRASFRIHADMSAPENTPALEAFAIGQEHKGQCYVHPAELAVALGDALGVRCVLDYNSEWNTLTVQTEKPLPSTEAAKAAQELLKNRGIKKADSSSLITTPKDKLVIPVALVSKTAFVHENLVSLAGSHTLREMTSSQPTP